MSRLNSYLELKRISTKTGKDDTWGVKAGESDLIKKVGVEEEAQSLLGMMAEELNDQEREFLKLIETIIRKTLKKASR